MAITIKVNGVDRTVDVDGDTPLLWVLRVATASRSALAFGSERDVGDEITRAFRFAARDSSVRTILFRIDSPGGSAVASESFCRALTSNRSAGWRRQTKFSREKVPSAGIIEHWHVVRSRGHGQAISRPSARLANPHAAAFSVCRECSQSWPPGQLTARLQSSPQMGTGSA